MKSGIRIGMSTNIHQPGAKTEGIDEQMKSLRSRISDLGSDVDADRAGIAASMGGGAFLVLLAALAAYDLFSGKAGVWLAVGIDRDTLVWIAWILAVAGVGLIARAIFSRRRGESNQARELASLEQQYAELLELKKSGADSETEEQGQGID
jgi:hypothetical protein